MRHALGSGYWSGPRAAHIEVWADHALCRNPTTGAAEWGFEATVAVYPRRAHPHGDESLWTRTLWCRDEQAFYRAVQNVARLIRSIPGPWERPAPTAGAEDADGEVLGPEP